MIKLDKAVVLAQLLALLNPIKGYVDGLVSALSRTMSEIMEEVDSSIIDLEAGILTFTDVEVAVNIWQADTTYSEYPYRAEIPCSGVTANHVPDVIFSLDDAVSCNYGPVALSDNGVVIIYARVRPDSAITIPTIEARKEVENGDGENQ